MRPVAARRAHDVVGAVQVVAVHAREPGSLEHAVAFDGHDAVRVAVIDRRTLDVYAKRKNTNIKINFFAGRAHVTTDYKRCLLFERRARCATLRT